MSTNQPNVKPGDQNWYLIQNIGSNNYLTFSNNTPTSQCQVGGAYTAFSSPLNTANITNQLWTITINGQIVNQANYYLNGGGEAQNDELVGGDTNPANNALNFFLSNNGTYYSLQTNYSSKTYYLNETVDSAIRCSSNPYNPIILWTDLPSTNEYSQWSFTLKTPYNNPDQTLAQYAAPLTTNQDVYIVCPQVNTYASPPTGYMNVVAGGFPAYWSANQLTSSCNGIFGGPPLINCSQIINPSVVATNDSTQATPWKFDLSPANGGNIPSTPQPLTYGMIYYVYYSGNITNKDLSISDPPIYLTQWTYCDLHPLSEAQSNSSMIINWYIQIPPGAQHWLTGKAIVKGDPVYPGDPFNLQNYSSSTSVTENYISIDPEASLNIPTSEFDPACPPNSPVCSSIDSGQSSTTLAPGGLPILQGHGFGNLCCNSNTTKQSTLSDPSGFNFIFSAVAVQSYVCDTLSSSNNKQQVVSSPGSQTYQFTGNIMNPFGFATNDSAARNCAYCGQTFQSPNTGPCNVQGGGFQCAPTGIGLLSQIVTGGTNVCPTNYQCTKGYVSNSNIPTYDCCPTNATACGTTSGLYNTNFSCGTCASPNEICIGGKCVAAPPCASAKLCGDKDGNVSCPGSCPAGDNCVLDGSTYKCKAVNNNGGSSLWLYIILGIALVLLAFLLIRWVVVNPKASTTDVINKAVEKIVNTPSQ